MPRVKSATVVDVADKIMLRKTSIVESVNGEPKNIVQIGILKTSVVYQLYYQCLECYCGLMLCSN